MQLIHTTTPPDRTTHKRLPYRCAPRPSGGDQGLMRCPKQPPKLAMLLLLALLLLCNGVGNVHCARIHDNSADLHALLDFKQGITDDPKGTLSNWNTTTHFCRWDLSRSPLCLPIPVLVLTVVDRPRRPVTGTTSCHGFDIRPRRPSSGLRLGCGGM
ncbi:hypothetical protein ZWY2020_021031 [Hordeum vulgare]|nr:hypothetical protein ZWY2020_021031 [Hordeum vulgare]